jgi:hypothetical protein
MHRLDLYNWTIKYSLAHCVNGEEHTTGLCSQYPDINTAELTFRADISDTPDWRKTIIHELLHVAHGRVDPVVEEAIIGQLDPAKQDMARIIYHQQVESYICALARSLYQMTKHEINHEPVRGTTDDT